MIPFMIIMISYLEEYVVPEVIAFYIASSFYRNAMWEATFKQHFNSAFDTFYDMNPVSWTQEKRGSYQFNQHRLFSFYLHIQANNMLCQIIH